MYNTHKGVDILNSLVHLCQMAQATPLGPKIYGPDFTL